MQYAHESVVLLPSLKCLHKLLNICEEFAIENDNTCIVHVEKTFCMFIKTKVRFNIGIPDVFLNGNVLQWITEHKYAVVIISVDYKDNLDIKRQIKSIYYTKGDILLRKLKLCV